MARYAKRRREEARELYLTNEVGSVAELARRLGLKPHTVHLWKREEDWEGLRQKVERRAAEQLVEQLAGARVKLNARHYKFWDFIGSKMVELLKKQGIETEEIRSLERLAAVLDRMQRGQRLARGMSLDGQTEEQIRAAAEADNRSLVDVFLDLVKQHVPDEETRDRIARGLYERSPMQVEGEEQDGE